MLDMKKWGGRLPSHVRQYLGSLFEQPSPPPSAPPPEIVALSPVEQAELRGLDAQRLAAASNLQVAEGMLRNRAHQIMAAHGIDLSDNSPDHWDLQIDQGVVRKKAPNG